MAKKKSNAHHEHHVTEHKDSVNNTKDTKIVKAKKVSVAKPKLAKPKILSDAPQEHYFFLCNGQVIKNVKELADIMENIDDGVFNYHVTADKNDFANWIKDIFENVGLANELAGVKDKGSTRLILYKHLASHL